jgi:hypothetical protein
VPAGPAASAFRILIKGQGAVALRTGTRADSAQGLAIVVAALWRLQRTDNARVRVWSPLFIRTAMIVITAEIF